jgi:hypothetical protein
MNLSPPRATVRTKLLQGDYVRAAPWYPTHVARETNAALGFDETSMKPHYFVPFSSLALFAAVAAFEACSSSSSSNGGTTATDQDADTLGDTSTTGPSGPVQCGPPPYITLGLVVEQVSSADAGAPRIGGAVLTSPLCPDASFTSDDDGGITGLVTENVPFYGRFNAPGFAPTLSPQEEFAANTPDVAIALPPSLLPALVPNYDQTKTLIFIDARKDTGTNNDGGANCDDVSGISFSVDGHPEGQVTYYTADAIPAAIPNGTATVGGAASITGIDVSASPVTITGTKSGCTISFLKGAATGKIPLENSYVSIAAAYLRN